MLRMIAVLTALLAAPATSATADEVADFYRGKTVRIVIGYGTGGGYDTYSKLLARFLGEHIPGKPTVIAQNMPGAGSRNAGNWLYNVAPKDGTVLGVLGQATPADQALGQPGIKFDVRKFNWIGNMVVVNNIMIVWSATGVRTIDDAKKRPLAIGATGASSPSVIYPTVANNLLGTQFKIVSGYPGGGDINLALERREVDGRGSDSWASLKSNNPAWIRTRRSPSCSRSVRAVKPICPTRRCSPNWRKTTNSDRSSKSCPAMRPWGVRFSPPLMCRQPACRRCARHSTTPCAIRHSSKPPRRPTCISTRWAAWNCRRSSTGSRARHLR
jgi:hypothetical protein